MRRARLIAASLAAVSTLVLAGMVGAQPPAQDERGPARPAPVPAPPAGPTAPIPTPPAKQEEPETPPATEPVPEPPRVPEELLQSRRPSFVGPDLFNPPAHQGWISITPSLTLSAEYNDNIFFTSGGRQSDVIFALTPGVTVSMQRPSYRLLAGYNVSGQIFLDQSELNDFGAEQQLFANFFYQLSPTVTFTAGDRFVFSRGTNELTSSGASLGLQESWRNTLSAGLRWQATQSTGFGVSASHTIVRVQESDFGDSDTYRVGLGVDHRLTARLSGNLGVGVAYLDFEGEPSAWTYTPMAGLGYDITPTLRGWINGGPSITERSGDISVTPAVSGGLTKLFKFGSASIGYDRAVTAETVGISDRQAVFASLDVITLLRGLRVGLTPRYSIVETDVSEASSSEDTIKTFTVSLQGTYQIARNISLIGSYTFFQQTTDRRGGRDDDIDQNRVFFGVQYAFPINIY